MLLQDLFTSTFFSKDAKHKQWNVIEQNVNKQLNDTSYFGDYYNGNNCRKQSVFKFTTVYHKI